MMPRVQQPNDQPSSEHPTSPAGTLPAPPMGASVSGGEASAGTEFRVAPPARPQPIVPPPGHAPFGLLAMGFYALGYTAYAAGVWAVEGTRLDPDTAAGLGHLTVMAWLLGTVLLFGSFVWLGITTSRAAKLVALHTASCLGLGILMLVVMGVWELSPTPFELLASAALLVDVTLLVVASMAVAGTTSVGACGAKVSS